jgi:nucleoside-diphosphate-sugar epimerase
MVGSLAARRLLRMGEQPVLFDVAFSTPNLAWVLPDGGVPMIRGDIREISELTAAIREHKVDRVIHTAALLTSAVAQRPLFGIQVNLMGTVNVLEAARQNGVERVSMAGANAVRLGLNGPDADPTLSENFRLHSVSERPTTIYATGKFAAEWFSQNYRDMFGLSTVTMRIGGVFGPWKGLPSGGPSRLMQDIIEAGWRDQPIRIGVADVKQSMDFVYADDVAKGLVLASQHSGAVSSVYNLSGGTLYSVTQVIELLEARLGRKVRVEPIEGPDASGYSPGQQIDIGLARKELGYEPDFPLEKAIDDFVRWLDQHAA